MRFRLCVPADLPRCHALVTANEPFSSEIAAAMLPVWQRWITRVPRTWAVIEDPERPPADRIRAFGLSVFVRDEVAEAQLRAPRPSFSHDLYARACGGGDATLSEPEVGARNRPPGLYLSSLHFATAAPFESADAQRAFQLGTMAFHALHGGYYLRSLLGVVFGPAWSRTLRAGGFELQSDFPELGKLDAPTHPFAYRLDRDRHVPSLLSATPSLFTWEAPRFRFTSAQRAVLQRALLDMTDGEIARELMISPDAVKKTWRAVYRRVELVAPHLLPGEEQRAPGQRGVEKRHRLLEHLRYRQSELRAQPPTRLASLTE